MENKQQFGFAIKRIKELAFNINQAEEISQDFEFGFGVLINFDIEASSFELQILTDLVNKENKKSFVHITVSNVFYIEDLKKYVRSDGVTFDIPDMALISMLSISISHTRALMAKNTLGTAYENYFIPIVNPTEMAKEIFKLNSN